MARNEPPDYGANDPTASGNHGYGGNVGAEPEPEPVPGWRTPIALVGWGLLIAVLIGLIIYGVLELTHDPDPAPAKTTTTTTTVTATTTMTTTQPTTTASTTSPSTTPPLTTTTPAATDTDTSTQLTPGPPQPRHRLPWH